MLLIAMRAALYRAAGLRGPVDSATFLRLTRW
jgi:hypothetical protein